jgi:HD-GYP domain-containing protein (c-di-GMP phosphodiesterase class II)
MGAELPGERVRLAELVAALSLGIDLGFAQPMEHVLRQSLIALRISDLLGADPAQRAQVYYTSLLINVACHSDAHEQAKWFGDDIALKSGKYEHDVHSMKAVAAGMRRLGSGHRPLERARIGVEFAVSGRRDVASMFAGHAQLAAVFATQLGLSSGVAAALDSAYEQWDGRGWPGTRSGAGIPLPARVAQLADFLEVAYRTGGIEAASALAQRQAGKQFDPAACGVVVDHAQSIFDDLDTVRAWDAVIEAEPALAVSLGSAEFDAALGVIADFVDLKSPYTLGHGRAVSELAAAAACVQGLTPSDTGLVRRAGLVHGLGRLGVSNAIWDRAGPLTSGEWERVRMYPYLTERMLRQSDALAPLGALALAHRERLDGSGYPLGLAGNQIPPLARLLGAAESYQTRREDRPHRPAHSPESTASLLHADVSAGRLDADAVDAVLHAVGHRVRRRLSSPAGLTRREIEVLQLLARGMSNKQIAQRLVISPKTAGNHVEHIYAKTSASNRASAGLFAMQHGLLDTNEITTPHIA